MPWNCKVGHVKSLLLLTADQKVVKVDFVRAIAEKVTSLFSGARNVVALAA